MVLCSRKFLQLILKYIFYNGWFDKLQYVLLLFLQKIFL